MKITLPVILSFVLTFITACNNDEPEFSASQIQNALSEMKGSYSGEMSVSYHHGDRISEGNECTFVSNDFLTVSMDLTSMALTVADENLASRLREIGVVQIKASYEFLQMDDHIYHFVLYPDDVICLDENDISKSVRIVFAQNFGGDADSYQHVIMFNLSPMELWIGDKKYEPFRPLVYHYEGTY